MVGVPGKGVGWSTQAALKNNNHGGKIQMIISRRKYERDLQVAEERGFIKAQEEFWRREECRGLQEQINCLKERVRKLEPVPEFVNPENAVTACRF